LEPQEIVHHDDVAQDLPGGVNLKVAGRERRKVRIHFLAADLVFGQLAHFVLEVHPAQFLGPSKLRPAGHQLEGLSVEGPKQGIFEPVPEFVAGGLRINKRMQRQHAQGFRIV
jgi:hypothetical protein